MRFFRRLWWASRLRRFVDAQDADDGLMQGRPVTVYERARQELCNGRKQTHWMWFIFPQARGLGISYNSKKFAISSLSEAKAYLEHPVLGPRLFECTKVVLSDMTRPTISDPTARLNEIFGQTDAMKFHSCMSLFEQASRGMAGHEMVKVGAP